jgi:hypothetical protein
MLTTGSLFTWLEDSRALQGMRTRRGGWGRGGRERDRKTLARKFHEQESRTIKKRGWTRDRWKMAAGPSLSKNVVKT